MSINDYRINRIIGKGSFATVFKAFSRKTQKPVAIKIFSKKMSKQEEELARKEVSISRTIDHPNIIHLYDEFRRNDTWYMVFEYCGKGDLDKLVGKKGTHKYYVGMLKEEIVALLAVELVEAVFYLAEKNIAHRDIKPANILITD
jgi:serine/threonine protein kinase